MKTFKLVDCIIQFLLFILAALFYLTDSSHREFAGNNASYTPYFCIGGWQLLSALIHTFNNQYNSKKLRRFYLILLLICFAMIVTGMMINDALIYILIVLLVLTGFIAVYYCLVCVIETLSIKYKHPQSTH